MSLNIHKANLWLQLEIESRLPEPVLHRRPSYHTLSMVGMLYLLLLSFNLLVSPRFSRHYRKGLRLYGDSHDFGSKEAS